MIGAESVQYLRVGLREETDESNLIEVTEEKREKIETMCDTRP